MKERETHLVNIKEKRVYLTPTLNVEIIEMECGIAANSGAVSPGATNGITDAVQTDWGGNDDTTIDTPY